MRKKVILSVVLVGIIGACVHAQTPFINSVTPISTYPNNKVLITGGGFSPTMGNLRVSFDHVLGTITASSDFSIEVTFPPQARLSNVEVLNTTTNLSAKFVQKIVPAFSGEDFDPLKIAAPLSTGAAEEVFDVCSCDLDSDGKPDFATTKQGVATDLLFLRNTSTLGNLSFTTTTVGVTAPTFNVACGDLNGDGKPDVIASRGGATRNEIFVLRNTSLGANSIQFAQTKLFMDVGHLSFRLAIRDLNMDGKPEVIATNAFDDPANGDNVIYVYVNTSTGGALSFAASPVKLTVTGASTSYGLDVQDLDGDGMPEIIVNPFTAGNVFVLRNTSSASVQFAASQLIALPGSLNHMTSADFNEDGRLDIAVTSSFDNRAIVLLNTSSGVGNIAFGTTINLTTGTFPWGIDASDADGDGDVDLLVGNRGVSVVDLTLFKNNGNNGALAFTPVSINAGKKSRNVRVGDYDGDGKPDFAYTTDNANSIDIIRSKDCYVPTIINVGPLDICPTQTIRLDAIPGLGVTTYAWEKDAVPTGTNNPFLDITAAGNYTVTATSETGACVKTSATLVVNAGTGTLPADPVPTSNSPVCSVAGAQLDLFGPTVAGAVYHWTGPNGFTSSGEDPSITPVTPAIAGTYYLQLSNGTCFTNVGSTVVDVANLQSFSVGSSVPSNTICQGSNLTLSVNSQAGHTYQWIKDGVDINLQTAATLLVTTEGAYSVRVTNTGLGCSITTSTTNVTVLVPPVSLFTVNSTACVGEDLAFTDQSTKDSRASIVYAWTFGDAGTSNVANPTHTYASAQAFVPALQLSYSGITGCTSSSTKNVTVNPSPTVTVTADKTSITEGDPVQLTASGATTYSWDPMDGLSNPAIANPVATPTETVTYTVTGTENNCPGTATITIDVTPIPPTTLSIPNVFTPNGDGANDEWTIPNIEPDCIVSLFDAAGRKILEKKGFIVVWDGMYSGSKAPEGTYYYVVTCPQAIPVTGHLLLAR